VPNWQTFTTVGHQRGPTETLMTIVVFADFECPFCQTFAFRLDSFAQRHPNVRIVERNLPLTIHENALQAAIVAECAARTGRYASMRREMYEHQGLIKAANWAALARSSGVDDVPQLLGCVTAQEPRSAIDEDIAAARQLGLTSTPSVMINDSLYIRPPTTILMETALQRLTTVSSVARQDR